MDSAKKNFSKLTRTKASSNAQINLKVEKSVHLSPDYQGSNLELSSDLMTVTGYKGYRSILANYPIIEGTYFFEAKIEKSDLSSFAGAEPQVRIGIATKKFDSEISLGSDKWSYGYKSIDGNVVHDGIKRPYGEEYKGGDIIGCMIHMKPPKPKMRGEIVDNEKIEINEGSKLVFFKNGRSLGTAFMNLYEGFYHAGVSAYMNAKVHVNFGPYFETMLDLRELDIEMRNYKPYCVRANEPKLYEDLEYF